MLSTTRTQSFVVPGYKNQYMSVLSFGDTAVLKVQGLVVEKWVKRMETSHFIFIFPCLDSKIRVKLGKLTVLLPHRR